MAAGAGEELADAAVGRCAHLVGIAVFKKLREHAYRLAAHAVADKVDLQRAVGVVKLGQNALEGAAVAHSRAGGKIAHLGNVALKRHNGLERAVLGHAVRIHAVKYNALAHHVYLRFGMIEYAGGVAGVAGFGP